MSTDDGDAKQREVYAKQAVIYDRLVGAEDHEANLDRLLASLFDFNNARVLDVGCGTGRMSRILFGLGAAEITGVDRSAAMLNVAIERFARETASGTFHAIESDVQEFVPRERAFDAAVAGWVFGHFRHWMPADWRLQVSKALSVLERSVRPGGIAIVIETLGTGHESPRTHGLLDEYFEMLEREAAYTRDWIRTDYKFSSVGEACAILGAFFPDALVASVKTADSPIVPECTGVWSKKIVV